MTDTTDKNRPIADWENRKLNGEPLSCKRVYESHVAEVTALRQRQEAYETDLPKKKGEALSEINRTLSDLRDTDGPEYAALASLTIIQELALKRSFDDGENLNDALFWLTSQGLDAMKSIQAGNRRARSIAHQFHPSHEEYKA